VPGLLRFACSFFHTRCNYFCSAP